MPSASVVTEFGPPDVLEWEDVAMPEPSAREIRIKVRISGVGPTDLKIRRGEPVGFRRLRHRDGPLRSQAQLAGGELLQADPDGLLEQDHVHQKLLLTTSPELA